MVFMDAGTFYSALEFSAYVIFMNQHTAAQEESR